jgi:hypothetical protein
MKTSPVFYSGASVGGLTPSKAEAVALTAAGSADALRLNAELQSAPLYGERQRRLAPRIEDLRTILGA